MLLPRAQYDLVQFHFHTPSEHAFNGVRDDMEVHLVHRRRGGSDLAVLGVMLSAKKQSRENKALGMALDYAPQYSFEEETIKNMDPNILLPPGGVEKTGIIRYQGSLTTPPCRCAARPIEPNMAQDACRHLHLMI